MKKLALNAKLENDCETKHLFKQERLRLSQVHIQKSDRDHWSHFCKTPGVLAMAVFNYVEARGKSFEKTKNDATVLPTPLRSPAPWFATLLEGRCSHLSFRTLLVPARTLLPLLRAYEKTFEEYHWVEPDFYGPLPFLAWGFTPVVQRVSIEQGVTRARSLQWDGIKITSSLSLLKSFLVFPSFFCELPRKS